MSSSSKRLVPRQVPAPEGSSAHASHGRFIPREELGGFSTWAPDPLPGAPVPRAVGSRSDTPASSIPHSSVTPSPSASHALAEDLEELQRTARQAGYHDGYRDGLAALENFKRSFAQQMASQVGVLVQNLQSEIQALEAEMAQSLVRSATGLARQIVRSELSARPELVAAVARDAVAAMSLSARRVELRLHAEDLELVQAGLGDELRRRDILLTADAGVSRGGCQLRSDLGEVDARIESLWRTALQRLDQNAEEWPLRSGEDTF